MTHRAAQSAFRVARDKRRARGSSVLDGCFGRARLGLAAGLLASIAGCALIAGCTLTEEPFDPVKVEVAASNPAQPDAGVSLAEPVTLGPSSLECGDAGACPADRVCVNGACVTQACADAEDISACEITSCVDGTCDADSCSDGLLSVGETDIDCGGSCGPCALGLACIQSADCRDAECVAGHCAVPTCEDGVHNQDESDSDCGGSCPPCASGLRCASDTDCGEGLFCTGDARICAPISCQDGIQNGAERAIDCGGGVCPGCPVDSPCGVASDCGSSVCGADGRCAAPSCNDGVHNQDELGVDCGGSCPTACGTGEPCSEPADCQSRVCGAAGCASGITECCQAASCSDRVANGTETAVDCGNAQCGPCAVGQACSANALCQTLRCVGGRCAQALLCRDGVRDGNEGDADCGGTEPGCARCADRRSCRVGADCASGDCANGVCVSCTDGVLDGAETGVDCGGGALSGCPACPPRCNDANSVDLGIAGTPLTLPANSCAKITLFPGYAPTLFDTLDVGPFPFGFSFTQACSGQSGTGTFNQAFQQTLLAGLSIDCAVVFDLQGSDAPVSLRWY
jgi:hypothetical protein